MKFDYNSNIPPAKRLVRCSDGTERRLGEDWHAIGSGERIPQSIVFLWERNDGFCAFGHYDGKGSVILELYPTKRWALAEVRRWRAVDRQ